MVWDRNTPWRQGKIINAEDCVALKLCDEADAAAALVVVASHDCDIAQLLTIEPNVEIIIGKIVTDLDGNFSHAKNARCLQLSIEGKTPQVGEFEATRKTVISKAELVSFKPSANHCLSPENATIFQLWLASRYRRSAFPDEFENRLKVTKIAGKIAKIVKPHSNDISGVFFDVDDGREVERIGSDDAYQLGITILYPSEPSPEISERTAISVEKEIRAVFTAVLFQPLQKWQHIELRYIDVMSEDAITYRQFKQLKRWRLDHISLVGSPQQAIVAE